jgi:integrase
MPAIATAMKRPPSPLEEALESRVRLLATTLRPATVQHYRLTVRLFTAYLGQAFPEVRRPCHLRRDPHVLGWLESLWSKRARSSDKPLCNHTRGGHLIRLRKLLDLLADHAFPPRPGLLLSEDIPRPDQVLPRPLTPQDDARLQAGLRERNDLLSNALLLTRLTGMRIGETVDLADDGLRHLGGGDWALHVPVGKLHSERWTPVDAEVCEIVARLRFLATLPGSAGAPAEFLLPRPKGRNVLCSELRAALAETATEAGISAHVVPHQLRHTYATSMLRAGVSLPALMKLLGHRTANMTLRYVEITQKDLQREFHLARQSPRHLLPLPAPLSPGDPDTADAAAVVERLSGVVRVLELYRQQHQAADHKPIQLLLRRLVRVRSGFQKLAAGAEK